MASLWLRNLGFYSLQILLIAAAGGLLIQVLRIRIPKARLICWQALLVACLLLPAIEPWRRLNIDSSVQITTGSFTPVDRGHGLGIHADSVTQSHLVAGHQRRSDPFWDARPGIREAAAVPAGFKARTRSVARS